MIVISFIHDEAVSHNDNLFQSFPIRCFDKAKLLLYEGPENFQPHYWEDSNIFWSFLAMSRGKHSSKMDVAKATNLLGFINHRFMEQV